jgi:hypothetical protein
MIIALKPIADNKQISAASLSNSMPSNISKVVGDLVTYGAIRADQKDEVQKLFYEWQKRMQSIPAYQMVEQYKKSIPEYMQQFTPDLTYEDSMPLSFAVWESNMNRAKRA